MIWENGLWYTLHVVMKGSPAKEGRRDCVALRDQIADYKRQHDRGVAFRGDDYTVYELTRRYVDLKQNVKHTTRAGYKTVLKILDSFGTKIPRLFS